MTVVLMNALNAFRVSLCLHIGGTGGKGREGTGARNGIDDSNQQDEDAVEDDSVDRDVEGGVDGGEFVGEIERVVSCERPGEAGRRLVDGG